MFNTIVDIFNFLYSPYFIFLLLFSGIMILITLYYNLENNNNLENNSAKFFGVFYISIAVISFLFDKFIIFLGS